MREMDCFFQTDLFIADTAHGFGIITGLGFCHEKSGVGLPGGNAGEPFCVLGLGADFPLQLLNNLQREAGAVNHEVGRKHY